MHNLLGMLVAFGLHAPVSQDSLGNPSEYEQPVGLLSPVHVIASTYGTIGTYSTETHSYSISGYATLTNAWRDYYTVGYIDLWLNRSDLGGKYFSQNLFTARGSWLLSGDRVSISTHYAYLDEGEIQSFSNPAVFHWMGAGGQYWFSPFQTIGTSLTLSLSEGTFVAGGYSSFFSFDVGSGIWSTTKLTVTDADFTARLFSLGQEISVPLGNDSYVVARGQFGRRGFFFDDEALIVYNQRAVQTKSFSVKGIIQTFSKLYLIPSLQYDAFDEYDIFYGSIGIRATW